MEERPGYEGFGLREVRQTVVDFGNPDRMLMISGLADTENFLVGDVMPVRGEDETAVWRVVETHRRDRLDPDGAVARDWVLRVEPID